MPTLYVVEPGARIEKEYHRLLVTREDEVLLRVPLRQVTQVVLVGSVGVTTPALHALLQAQVPLLLVQRTGALVGRLMPAMPRNLPLRQAQYRRNDDLSFCLEMTRAIVGGKLRNQRVLALRILRRQRGDRSPLQTLKAAEKDGAQAANIETLRGLEGTALLSAKQPRSGTQEEAWLREAIRQRYGLEGIIRLAREEGERYPLAYLEWFEALRQAGDFTALLGEAEQALQRIPPKQPQRAAVADVLAEAAQHQGEETLFRQARRAALISEPTLKRLLDLWEALPPAERTAEMCAVAQRIAEELPQRGDSFPFYETESGRPISPTPMLYLYTLILGQQWEKALQLGQEGKPLGWSSISRPQGIFTTVALMLLGNFSPTRLPPRMMRMWETIWNSGWENIMAGRNETERSRLERALEETLVETQLAPDFEQTLLEACQQIVTARVAAIVGGQYRKSYHKAAALLVACGEMITARGGDGKHFIATGRQVFPRHRAFQEEVETALRSR